MCLFQLDKLGCAVDMSSMCCYDADIFCVFAFTSMIARSRNAIGTLVRITFSIIAPIFLFCVVIGGAHTGVIASN